MQINKLRCRLIESKTEWKFKFRFNESNKCETITQITKNHCCVDLICANIRNSHRIGHSNGDGWRRRRKTYLQSVCIVHFRMESKNSPNLVKQKKSINGNIKIQKQQKTTKNLANCFVTECGSSSTGSIHWMASHETACLFRVQFFLSFFGHVVSPTKWLSRFNIVGAAAAVFFTSLLSCWHWLPDTRSSLFVCITYFYYILCFWFSWLPTTRKMRVLRKFFSVIT